MVRISLISDGKLGNIFFHLVYVVFTCSHSIWGLQNPPPIQAQSQQDDHLYPKLNT